MPRSVATGTVDGVSRCRLLRVLAGVLVTSLVLVPASATSAHDDGDDVVWGEDPADIVVAQDCTVMQRNFYAVYALDRRLDRELAARATRMEIESAAAVVTGFTIASPGWRPHVEQPDALAHAERRSSANTLGDLLLRIGLEARDGGSPASVALELRVFTGEGSESFLLEAPRVVEVDDPSAAVFFRQWCHEPSQAPESTPSPSGGSTGGGPGPFRGVLPLVGVLGILGASGVLLLRRLRR